jgi:hypothetical protein
VVWSALAWAAGPAFGEVQGFKVTTDRTIDASSLETIVRQVLARSGARTNDEKAIALYEYLHNTIFHWQYPTEPEPQSVGPLKAINVYGWSLCGGQHTILKALFETAGWECRYVGWPGHTTVEVKYDGRWHYFDVFLKCYYWTKDKSHVASQEEIAHDPTIVLDAVKDGRAARQNLCCGDTMQDVIEGCQSHKVVGDVKGWASVTWRDRDYSPLLNLPAGASVRLDWKAYPNGFAVRDKPPQHSCGLKDLVNDRVLGPVAEHYGPRNWSNGRLVYAPDFTRLAEVADVALAGARAEAGKLVATGGRGVAVFKVPLPYVYVSAQVEAAFEGAGQLFVSADAGRTWKPAAAGDISELVRQRYDVWVKAEFAGALARFRLEAVVEHNRGALPYLVPGTNTVTVALAKNELPREGVLTVTYVYQEATAPAPDRRKRFDGGDVTYGPTRTVTREITALPYTFAIEVGGTTPPRMIALERGVRGQ